jgi:hypothetical protein
MLYRFYCSPTQALLANTRRTCYYDVIRRPRRATLTKPTQRIAKHFGSAIAHEASAKKERTGAQREFNIAHYYEAKQRLLNPAYRSGVDGGKDRTPSDNEKWFGAPNWEAFNEQCQAYCLQHSD